MSNDKEKKSIGFILLRHVNNETTNKYWIHCYECIRKYYPENHILIIDDNSDYTYITNEKLYKTVIINSEYPKRGELLPLYYYLQTKLFDIAVIVHDSVFINKYLDFHVETYRFLWEFEHIYDHIEDETRIIDLFRNKELLAFYENKNGWKGCFGAMMIISHDFLKKVFNKYDINILLDCITTRYNRCLFERVIATIIQKEERQESLLGNIHSYCKWDTRFDEKDDNNHLPIIKVWTGR
jgi:hypothetical protein